MNKEKLVLHISKTSLAGAPIRLSDALNKYTKYKSRLLDFMPLTTEDGLYKYPEDLNWHDNAQREEAKKLIKEADIIHFHHYIDIRINPFLTYFDKEAKAGCKFIRQFHSPYEFINRTEIRFEENYKKDNLPKVVIPHCAERTFLNLDIVPNIIPIDEEYCRPLKTNNKKLRVLYSASCKTPRLQERWATKGYPELRRKLKKLRLRDEMEA